MSASGAALYGLLLRCSRPVGLRAGLAVLLALISHVGVELFLLRDTLAGSVPEVAGFGLQSHLLIWGHSAWTWAAYSLDGHPLGALTLLAVAWSGLPRWPARTASDNASSRQRRLAYGLGVAALLCWASLFLRSAATPGQVGVWLLNVVTHFGLPVIPSLIFLRIAGRRKLPR
jgi:hypothetical protein